MSPVVGAWVILLAIVAVASLLAGVAFSAAKQGRRENWRFKPTTSPRCECGHDHLWWRCDVNDWMVMPLCGTDDCSCYEWHPEWHVAGLPGQTDYEVGPPRTP